MDSIKRTTIVDVRTAAEFLSGHIPGAINIPLDEVQQRLTEFRNLPKPLLAYCRSGGRSGMAVAILKQNGIVDVVNGGGMEAVRMQLS